MRLGLVERHRDEPEDDEETAYAYRLEVVVPMTFGYTMSFNPAEFELSGSDKHQPVLQIYSTKFKYKASDALVDLEEKVPIIEAYAKETGMQYVTVELVKIFGGGPLRERKWTVIDSYDSPDDIPGFKRKRQ